MSDEICRAEDVVVRYGKATAVEGAHLYAEAGTTTALVGPNGAGKSSLFNAIAGVVPAVHGTVRLLGDDVSRSSATARARKGLVVVPQGRQLFPRLTVRENLQVVADALGCSSTAYNAALDRFPILRTREKSLAGVLSGGEQQMLAIARGLMSEPKVLLLDEPTLGLAPTIVADLMSTVAGIAAAGTAVVIAEPSIHVVRNVVSGGSVIVRGRIVARTETAHELEAAYKEHLGLTATPQTPQAQSN